MIAAVCQGLFFIPAQLLGPDHSFWALSEREARELAAAVIEVLDTLPAKQSKKFEKYFAEYGPYIKLAIVAGAIIYGRYSASVRVGREKKKADELDFRTIGPDNPNPYSRPGVYDPSN